MAGSGAKRPNGKWLARYRDEAKREHTKTFDTKRDGQAWLDTVTTAVVTGAYVDPKIAKTPFRAFAASWQSGQLHGRGTQRKVDSVLKVHILPVFGDRPIASIRRTEIQNWIAAMTRDGAAPSSVRFRYVWLAAILKAAEEDRLITRSPALGISLPTRSRQVEDLLTTDQVIAIAKKMDPQYEAIIWVMAGLGLRGGEAAGLSTSQIDFLRKTLTVDRQLTDENPRSSIPRRAGSSG